MARRDELEISRSSTLRSRRASAAKSGAGFSLVGLCGIGEPIRGEFGIDNGSAFERLGDRAGNWTAVTGFVSKDFLFSAHVAERFLTLGLSGGAADTLALLPCREGDETELTLPFRSTVDPGPFTGLGVDTGVLF